MEKSTINRGADLAIREKKTSLKSIKCPHCNNSIVLTNDVLKQAGIILTEEQRLTNRQKEMQMRLMNRKIGDLSEIANSVTPNLKGDTLEFDLNERFEREFPQDKFTRTPNRGADILQEVYDSKGLPCGLIVWEAKRRKNWERGWVEKLKKDQKNARAEIAVIVTKTLPSDCDNFRLFDGVWVTNFECVIALAKVLRGHLVDLIRTRRASSKNQGQLGKLQDFLISPDFRHQVELIVSSFISMQKDLEQEQRAMLGIWEKRRRQINNILENISGIAGSLDRNMDTNFLQIKGLSLLNELGDDSEQ